MFYFVLEHKLKEVVKIAKDPMSTHVGTWLSSLNRI